MPPLAFVSLRSRLLYLVLPMAHGGGTSSVLPQSHRRMKTNQEWEWLEQKIAGTAHDWKVQTCNPHLFS